MNEPTYNPYSTLEILGLKEQSDSKEKCLILKNVCEASSYSFDDVWSFCLLSVLG